MANDKKDSKKGKDSKEPNEVVTEPKDGQAEEPRGPEFGIQRIYVKGLSFEAPNTPAIFLENWEPEMTLDLGTKTESLGDNVHKVLLTVTVTVKVRDKTAFLVEVQQAGIFMLKGFPEEQLQPMLGSFCPNILYPYAREVVTDAVVRGGFPQLYLTPVNFDALYEQHRANASQPAAEGESGGIIH